MAKVFEALRRAEAQRKRQLGGDPKPVSAVSWPVDEVAQPPSVEPGFWRRLINRLSRSSPPDEIEGAADVNRRRIALLQPDSYVAEQFRTLRGHLDSLGSSRTIRTVAVTSANSGEGKSTASINLALVTAMSVGRETLLVDCDLRRPKIQHSLGLEPRYGLAEVLLDEVSLDEAIVKMEGLNLHVLAVRSRPPNPSELLSSARMRELIEEISRRYDRAILDTPAALGLSDAKTVAELCDGMVMVVRADKTPRRDVEAAMEALGRNRILGLVLNGSKEMRERYGYY